MSTIKISESQSFPPVINVKRGPKLRRYVPERTCRPIHTRERWECDACGCVIRPGFMPEFHGVGVLRYCPNCGARGIRWPSTHAI